MLSTIEVRYNRVPTTYLSYCATLRRRYIFNCHLGRWKQVQLDKNLNFTKELVTVFRRAINMTSTLFACILSSTSLIVILERW
jgi:hypothetical protein